MKSVENGRFQEVVLQPARQLCLATTSTRPEIQLDVTASPVRDQGARTCVFSVSKQPWEEARSAKENKRGPRLARIHGPCHAATFGTSPSTNRRNRELLAPATNDTCDASASPAAEVFAFVPPACRDRLLRPPAPIQTPDFLADFRGFLFGQKDTSLPKIPQR